MKIPADNLRKYGSEPFGVAVIHGGPGAAGAMAPVAKELSSVAGVLEPLQTSPSIEGQLGELNAVLAENADLPISLIGWSWGAWLGYIFAEAYPSMVKKLIIVASGPFTDTYAAGIMAKRLERLDEDERREVETMMDMLGDSETIDKNAVLRRIGALLSRADSFDALPFDDRMIDVRYDIFERVWREAQELRKTGELLKLGENIRCPVVAIHGDYDPHPHEGVVSPLSSVLTDFRFILLKNCGHTPWLEKAARREFYDILEKELRC